MKDTSTCSATDKPQK